MTTLVVILDFVHSFLAANTLPTQATLCLRSCLEELRLPRARPQTRPDARTRNLSKGPPRHKVWKLAEINVLQCPAQVILSKSASPLAHLFTLYVEVSLNTTTQQPAFHMSMIHRERIPRHRIKHSRLRPPWKPRETILSPNSRAPLHGKRSGPLPPDPDSLSQQGSMQSVLWTARTTLLLLLQWMLCRIYFHSSTRLMLRCL